MNYNKTILLTFLKIIRYTNKSRSAHHSRYLTKKKEKNFNKLLLNYLALIFSIRADNRCVLRSGYPFHVEKKNTIKYNNDYL